MKKKTVTAILLLLIASLVLSSCGGGNAVTDPAAPESTTAAADKDGFVTVTDAAGRSVTVPNTVKHPVCIGAGALRLYSYIGDLTLLAGVENCEKGFLISSRPYQFANEELFKSLPSIGAGGPQGAADAEALKSASPDVIFAVYVSFEKADFDELQQKTGIPVIALSYGQTEAFDEKITESITLMGKILHREDRAKEVTDFISDIKNDLNERTKDISDTDKKSVYLGCLNKFGSHGIGSSTAGYSLFDAVNAKNVLDTAGYKGYQGSIDTETLITLNPEVVILDAGGLSIFKEEYAKNSKTYNSLSAFKNGEVYVQMPYNAYYTNLETAYANAYFIGKTLFPDKFADIDITEKFNFITNKLLGKSCADYVYDTVGISYGKLDLSALA